MLWLGTNGNVTNVEPTAPTSKISVGMVLRSNANNGVVYVKIRAIARNQKLSDVYAPTLTGGDVLRWNNTTLRFETFNITSALSNKVDTSRTITAGNGLTGGGDLTANSTIDINPADDSLTVTADNVNVNTNNTLTSTSTTQPLSANQGKVLNEKVVQVETDLNKTLSLIDITNYALYVDTYTDKRYNPSTGVLEVSAGKNATSLCLVDKNNDICVGTNGYSTVCFYDKNKIFISSITNAYFARTILKSEIPSNCFYIAFTYTVAWLQTNVFYTRTTGDTVFGPHFYSSIKKIKGSRPKINIYLSDTQSEILRKLVDAILTQDCDVYFEIGEYNFDQIYVDMVDLYS